MFKKLKRWARRELRKFGRWAKRRAREEAKKWAEKDPRDI